MKSIHTFIIIFLFVIISSFVFGIEPHKENDKKLQYTDEGFKPKNGFVPDSITALKVAETILIPIIGKKEYVKQKPFKAELVQHDSVWYVHGTLPQGYVGGTAWIDIRRSDCKILYMTEEK